MTDAPPNETTDDASPGDAPDDAPLNDATGDATDDAPDDAPLNDATGDATDDAPDDAPPDDAAPLPDTVIDDAERLTRLARQATADAEREAYRADREEALAAHDYTARIRDEDDTLVLYPDEWIDGDTVQLARIDDTDRAVEIPLSGGGEDAWAAVEADNAALVDAVGEAHGPIHEANARAFADFIGNHYCRRIETATADHLAEFREEYYPRNVWADADQQAAIEDSLGYLFAAADTECPERSAKR